MRTNSALQNNVFSNDIEQDFFSNISLGAQWNVLSENFENIISKYYNDYDLVAFLTFIGGLRSIKKQQSRSILMSVPVVLSNLIIKENNQNLSEKHLDFFRVLFGVKDQYNRNIIHSPNYYLQSAAEILYINGYKELCAKIIESTIVQPATDLVIKKLLVHAVENHDMDFQTFIADQIFEKYPESFNNKTFNLVLIAYKARNLELIKCFLSEDHLINLLNVLMQINPIGKMNAQHLQTFIDYKSTFTKLLELSGEGNVASYIDGYINKILHTAKQSDGIVPPI